MASFLKSKAMGWVRLGLVLAIGWFYFWTAVPEWHPGLVARDSQGYYNLLTRGFMKGRLSLDVEADPFLATLKDPSDPLERGAHGMHDVSYFHGRYYLYFGVSPVLLLFLPFRVITGFFIDEGLASPVFATVGLVASVWLVLAIRKRHFPTASGIVAIGCVLALGLADMMPVLLRRTSVWEVPITCGYACCLVGLAAIFQALHARRPELWLAAAAIAFGFAVGSRPTYLFACAALVPPLWHGAKVRCPGATPWSDSSWRRMAFAALLPLLAIGFGLAAYNYLRFGNPLDFGFRHQLSGENATREQLFGWRFFLYNCRVYILAPTQWIRYFPFVTAVKLPAAPPGYLGAEDPYGILPNIPVVLFGAGILSIAGLRRLPAWASLNMFCLSLFAVAATTGITLTAYSSATNRYMVDFLPALVILACIGLLAVTTRPWYQGAVRTLGNLAACALIAYSAAFGVFASLRHNELFRADHPALYRQIAHRWNWPSYEFDRWRKTSYGPVEMKVIFPTDKVGLIEPLVVTGRSFLSDYLFVHYLGPDSIRFGLEHTSRGTFLGQPISVKLGQPHTLRIDMGSLYPPAAHPYFDSMSPAEARLRQNTLRVAVDGQVALERELTFYDAVGPVPSIGFSGDRLGFAKPFSGRILSWRRMPDARLDPLQSQYGSFRLELVFPSFNGRRSEPLVSTGATGRGDLIYVRYESSDRVSFGNDHWSTGGDVSAPLGIDPKAVQVVEIDFGALHPALSADSDADSAPAGRSRLVIRLNGRTALDEPTLYFPCDPGTVTVGLNAIQASSAGAVFTGSMIKVERGTVP